MNFCSILLELNHTYLPFLFTVAPRIDRKHLRDITISEGEMLKFDANIIGEPAPDVIWRKEDREIDTTRDKSLIITNVPYNTKLIIKTVKRSDAGTYTVKATNEHGKDQVIVNLTVIGRPGTEEQTQGQRAESWTHSPRFAEGLYT